MKSIAKKETGGIKTVFEDTELEDEDIGIFNVDLFPGDIELDEDED